MRQHKHSQCIGGDASSSAIKWSLVWWWRRPSSSFLEQRPLKQRVIGIGALCTKNVCCVRGGGEGVRSGWFEGEEILDLQKNGSICKYSLDL
ncbi:hypothetical protein ACS0TY_027028 [Phlomoides rotata]